MKLIDTHAHIQQHDPGELAGILERAGDAGVGAIIAAGVTVEDSRRCVQLASEHSEMFAGVGVHPTDLTGPLTQYDLKQLEHMAADENVVVMSEIGIDHQAHVLNRPADSGQSWTDIQDEAFRQQVEIARQHSLPIVFHVREPDDNPDANSAWPLAMKALKETSASDLGGTAHYFQGNAETAKAMLDAGFMISFARPLLRLKRLTEIASWIPLDQVLLESDSYPQPFKKDRMKWTEPRHLQEVAECLAQVRSLSVEEIIEQTTENTLRMLRGRADQVRAVVKP